MLRGNNHWVYQPASSFATASEFHGVSWRTPIEWKHVGGHTNRMTQQPDFFTNLHFLLLLLAESDTLYPVNICENVLKSCAASRIYLYMYTYSVSSLKCHCRLLQQFMSLWLHSSSFRSLSQVRETTRSGGAIRPWKTDGTFTITGRGD